MLTPVFCLFQSRVEQKQICQGHSRGYVQIWCKAESVSPMSHVHFSDSRLLLQDLNLLHLISRVLDLELFYSYQKVKISRIFLFHQLESRSYYSITYPLTRIKPFGWFSYMTDTFMLFDHQTLAVNLYIKIPKNFSNTCTHYCCL